MMVFRLVPRDDIARSLGIADDEMKETEMTTEMETTSIQSQRPRLMKAHQASSKNVDDSNARRNALSGLQYGLAWVLRMRA